MYPSQNENIDGDFVEITTKDAHQYPSNNELTRLENTYPESTYNAYLLLHQHSADFRRTKKPGDVKVSQAIGIVLGTMEENTIWLKELQKYMRDLTRKLARKDNELAKLKQGEESMRKELSMWR